MGFPNNIIALAPCGVVLGLVCIVVLAVYLEGKRRERLDALFNAYCLANGWAHHPKGMPIDDDLTGWEQFFTPNKSERRASLYRQLSRMRPLNSGHEGGIGRLICKQIDAISVYAFEFSYVVSTGKSSTTYYFIVVAFRQPLMLPYLELRPEGVLDRMGKMIGAREMQLESEEFNKKYFVKTSDDRRAHMILDPLMIEWLMECPETHWQLEGPWILRYQSGRFENPIQKDALEAQINDFIQRIPRLVNEDHGFESNWKAPEEL